MKCIKLNSGECLRVDNDYADYLVKQGEAEYSDRKKWKDSGREYLTETDRTKLNKEKNNASKRFKLE